MICGVLSDVFVHYKGVVQLFVLEPKVYPTYIYHAKILRATIFGLLKVRATKKRQMETYSNIVCLANFGVQSVFGLILGFYLSTNSAHLV